MLTLLCCTLGDQLLQMCHILGNQWNSGVILVAVGVGVTCSHSFPKILFPPMPRLSLSHSVISKHQIRCRISSHHQFIIIVNQKEIPFAWDIFSLSSGKIAQNSSHSFTFKLAAQAFCLPHGRPRSTSFSPGDFLLFGVISASTIYQFYFW